MVLNVIRTAVRAQQTPLKSCCFEKKENAMAQVTGYPIDWLMEREGDIWEYEMPVNDKKKFYNNKYWKSIDK